MRKTVSQRMEELLRHRGVREIVLITEMMSPALRAGYSLDEDLVEISTAIGMAGWIAWTEADRVRDLASPATISESCVVFSVAHSIMDSLIESASLCSEHRMAISSLIGEMEKANMEERLGMGRGIGHRLSLSMSKSIGIAIPSMIMLFKAGASDTDIGSCLSYFRSLILARQLSDDACDWREDMEDGLQTPVTALLIEEAGKHSEAEGYADAFERTVKRKAANIILAAAGRSIACANRISCLRSKDFLTSLPRAYADQASKIISSALVARPERSCGRRRIRS